MHLRYYREVERLQDGRDFRADFETDVLVGLLSEPRREDSDCKMVLLNRLEAEVRYLHRRNAYVALKWLIFLHRVLQKAPSPEAAEGVLCLLERMTPPSAPEKIDQYLLKKLVSPYKQYLTKLACRVQESASAGADAAPFQAYSEYNFINCALTEFAAPVREFTSYFSQEYPCLNAYIDLVGRDLAPLYRAVLEAFEENLIGRVTFIEIEKMGVQMHLLSRGRQGKNELQATADNSSSSNQNKTEPCNSKPISAFPSLETSNLALFSNH